MFALAVRSSLANKRRLVGTALSVMLGVAFLAGTLVFTDTIGRTFDQLFAGIYDDVDTYVRSESTVELELRSPDNMANPYLALAVALASALDGIQRGEEPPLASDENLVRHDDAELARLGVESLPQTLGDALAALAEDDVIREALGDYVCDQFLVVKRAEWTDYRRYVSPWERERYGD